jgi:hypothetical protein
LKDADLQYKLYESTIMEQSHILDEKNNENRELQRKIDENEINLNNLIMQLAQEKSVLDVYLNL